MAKDAGRRAQSLRTDAGDAMNSILAIHPYRAEGLWVFDDARVGLVQEPFICGADLIIERLSANIPDAASGFTFLFSASPFPGCDAQLDWRQEHDGGNWYYCAKVDVEGWLCPALFKYFDAAPKHIFVQCKPRAAQAGPAAGGPELPAPDGQDRQSE